MQFHKGQSLVRPLVPEFLAQLHPVATLLGASATSPTADNTTQQCCFANAKVHHTDACSASGHCHSTSGTDHEDNKKGVNSHSQASSGDNEAVNRQESNGRVYANANSLVGVVKEGLPDVQSGGAVISESLVPADALLTQDGAVSAQIVQQGIQGSSQDSMQHSSREHGNQDNSRYSPASSSKHSPESSQQHSSQDSTAQTVSSPESNSGSHDNDISQSEQYNSPNENEKASRHSSQDSSQDSSHDSGQDSRQDSSQDTSQDSNRAVEEEEVTIEHVLSAELASLLDETADRLLRESCGEGWLLQPRIANMTRLEHRAYMLTAS